MMHLSLGKMCEHKLCSLHLSCIQIVYAHYWIKVPIPSVDAWIQFFDENKTVIFHTKSGVVLLKYEHVNHSYVKWMQFSMNFMFVMYNKPFKLPFISHKNAKIDRNKFHLWLCCNKLERRVQIYQSYESESIVLYHFHSH